MKVRVRDLTPVANVSGPYLAFGSDPVDVTFNAAGSVDPRGGVLTGTWDFGDGTPPLVTTNLRPVHRYGGTVQGTTTYTVTLVLSSSSAACPTTRSAARHREGKVVPNTIGFGTSGGDDHG